MVLFHDLFCIHFWGGGGGGSTSMFTSGGSTSMFTSRGSTSEFTSRGVHFHVHFWGGPLLCSLLDGSHVTYPIMHLMLPLCSPDTKWWVWLGASAYIVLPQTVADPGFPIGGCQPHRCQLPRWLCFEKFVCQNERIWTLRGGTHWWCPLDLPMPKHYGKITWDPPTKSLTDWQTDKHLWKHYLPALCVRAVKIH